MEGEKKEDGEEVELEVTLEGEDTEIIVEDVIRYLKRV